MTDIVERLRNQFTEWNNPPSPELPEGAEVVIEAAAEIERLRDHVAKLNDALDLLRIADEAIIWEHVMPDGSAFQERVEALLGIGEEGKG